MLNCWQFEATLHFSMCRYCVQYHTHYMDVSVSETETKYVVENHHSCRTCERENVRIMCACMLTACHNVGKAAYYTEGLYKMF